MQNYLLNIEYSGKNYSGWQIQPNVKTVQGEIVKAINIISVTEINLIGSGRTDAGVHALGQVANFQFNQELDLYKFKHSLNSLGATWMTSGWSLCMMLRTMLQNLRNIRLTVRKRWCTCTGKEQQGHSLPGILMSLKPTVKWDSQFSFRAAWAHLHSCFTVHRRQWN